MQSPSVVTLAGAGMSDARIEIRAGLGWRDLFRLAIEDVVEGASMWRLIWTLSFLDIKLRYRGSLLGPLWLTLSTGVMIGTMGFVYSYLFHTNMTTYFTFLTFSIVSWNFISLMITEGCDTFIKADSVIKGMKLPFSLYAARTVVRNLIILAHNIVVVVVVFAVFRVPATKFMLLAVPGFLLWLIDGFLISLLLGTFCMRFRDVPQIVLSVLQVIFFATPIMWQLDLIKGHSTITTVLALNPFYALLHIVRAPILGHHIGMMAWADALLCSSVLLVVTVLVFARLRGRIAFWV